MQFKEVASHTAFLALSLEESGWSIILVSPLPKITRGKAKLCFLLYGSYSGLGTRDDII